MASISLTYRPGRGLHCLQLYVVSIACTSQLLELMPGDCSTVSGCSQVLMAEIPTYRVLHRYPTLSSTCARNLISLAPAYG